MLKVNASRVSLACRGASCLGIESSRVHQAHRRRSGGVESRRARLRFRRRGAGGLGPAVQADGDDRDPQHLHLLLRRLRHPDLQPGRPREERQVQHHPYRGRSGPSGEPRHAVPERLGAARHRARADPAESPEIPRARQQRVQGGLLGLRARSHRHADEAGPRRELHRQERRRHHGQPLAQHRHAGGVGVIERNLLPDLEGRALASGCWSSTTRRVSDTDRRWPVWPQHSVAAQ